jgi:hypothetical protein
LLASFPSRVPNNTTLIFLPILTANDIIDDND